MSKIVDREGLKAFRERLDEKYVIEGEYSPQTSVGLADNFTPYSENSGAEQSNPFISNGTGTNNNQEIVTVGDYGLLKSKNGNTVCVNQWFNFTTLQSITVNGITFTNNNDGSITLNGTATSTSPYELITKPSSPIFPIGHKILVLGQTKNPNYYIQGYSDTIGVFCTENTEIFTMPDTGTNYNYLRIRVANGTTLNNVKIVPNFIDLTQWFNGNIPQDILDNPSHFSWYYNGDLSYNTGTLVNANGVKLVSTGRNQWDEQWENGYYSTSTGLPVSNANYIRSKNTKAIKVIPNKSYCFALKNQHSLVNHMSTVLYYDNSGNYLGYKNFDIDSGLSQTFDTPSNCFYIKFYMSDYYGTSYANDITISLYYTPEQGYDKHYPYEAPYEVDTDSEVLRSAGSVYDYKEPNGIKHIVIGSYTFTGNESWVYFEAYHLFVMKKYDNPNFPDCKNNAFGNNSCICDKKYITNKLNSWSWVDNTIGVGTSFISSDNRSIVVRDDSFNGDITTFASSMAGKTIYFELTTETTEQGTPFAENLPINDYGMLYWLDENNNLVDIPQGNTIFFPINYKGFLDDMYHRVDGDSSSYVIDAELQASETQRDTIDTQLKNAIGGALRQLLAVSKSIDFNNIALDDLGELNWTYNSSNGFFIGTLSNSSITNTLNILSTKYKRCDNANGSDMNSGNLKIGVALSNWSNIATQVFVRDTTYTDATTFKNAMKGVLLAYEKAS